MQEERKLSFDTQIKLGEVPLMVAVFDTPAERELGLMHVKHLPQGTGALFVFEKEQNVSFWMKNVSFPVDMLFFDGKKRLIDKREGVQPCFGESCQRTSASGVRYVLELSGKNMVVGYLSRDVLLQSKKAQILR